MMIAMSVIPATAAITIHKVLFFRPPTTCAPAAAASGPELDTVGDEGVADGGSERVAIFMTFENTPQPFLVRA